jgi:hypothetical protein
MVLLAAGPFISAQRISFIIILQRSTDRIHDLGNIALDDTG